jgi:hypothetical protein
VIKPDLSDKIRTVITNLSGGHVKNSRELLISNQDKTTDFYSLNWKSALQIILCKTINQINSERAWAKLCAHLRATCPETTWYSICENYEDLDQEIAIQKIGLWLESFIMSTQWLFPEKVMIMSLQESSSWRIVFLNQHELPLYPAPEGFQMKAWQDEISCGWELQINSGDK